MKIGVRTPSLEKRIKAATTGKIKRTVNKAVNPIYGKKGMGLVTDPEKALYNKVYGKTSFDILDKPKKKIKTKDGTEHIEEYDNYNEYIDDNDDLDYFEDIDFDNLENIDTFELERRLKAASLKSERISKERDSYIKQIDEDLKEIDESLKYSKEILGVKYDEVEKIEPVKKKRLYQSPLKISLAILFLGPIGLLAILGSWGAHKDELEKLAKDNKGSK